MPRPKFALISRRRTLEAALHIIDTEGLDALSLRRLAIELNVNAASLYHHFSNKEEILVGAAMLALSEVRTPDTHDEEWPVWLRRNGDRLRRALVAHPDLIPIMMRRDLLCIGVAELESTAALLEEERVPVGAIAPILDYGELLAIVCALAETEHRSGVNAMPSEKHPHLHKAYLKRSTSIDQIFAEAYMAGVEAIVNDVRASAGAPMPTRAAARPAVAKRAAGKSAAVPSSGQSTAARGK